MALHLRSGGLPVIAYKQMNCILDFRIVCILGAPIYENLFFEMSSDRINHKSLRCALQV